MRLMSWSYTPYCLLLAEAQSRHHLQQPLTRQAQFASGPRSTASGAGERQLDELALELIARLGEASRRR